MVTVVARSHEGLVRLNNEDSVYADDSGRFAILADGMGGLMAGDVASRTAVESARSRLRRRQGVCESGEQLEEVLYAAHDSLVARAKKFNYVGKMGTTLVIWVSAGPGADSFFCHVGDSRLYSYTDGTLQQVTRDHTLAQRMLDNGEIEADSEVYAKNSHVLTQALGLPGLCVAQSGTVAACDRVLICTDGLSDLVSDEHIARILATQDLERCADDLLKAALDAGGRDNVSVILLDL